MTSPVTSSSLSFGRRSGGLSLARARLYLGISGVGTAVVGALCVLAFDLPTVLFSTSTTQAVPEALRQVGSYFALVAGLFFLFDLMGGAWFVRRRHNAAVWVAGWARGAVMHWGVTMSTALLLLVAARAGGVPAAIGAFVVGQLVLAQWRGRFARLVARFDVVPTAGPFAAAAQRVGLDASRLLVLATEDEGFVGGWSGIGARQLLVPQHWSALPADALAAQLARRVAIATSGAHWRGALGGALWNTIGFLVVLAVTGATPATAAGLVTLSAAMTLWAFLGVLLLPTPSRAAVYAADASAARAVGAAATMQAIERLDRWQDDEATRPPLVERIFHPVPSRTPRLARLRAGSGRALSAWDAHHLARHALWLGWGTLSPIARVVHCNVGRPALWAMLPGD